ncbi:MAG: cupredoxin domain-containing protein [Longimicrobiales bacterium]
MRHPASILALVLLAGCFSEDPAGTDDTAGDVTIAMTSQLTYAPLNATARVGQVVRWENDSNAPHTVTADPALAVNAGSVSLPAGAGVFGSELIAPGGAYTHTFTVAGTYRYFCRPHEGAGMIGTIVITE